MKTLMKNLTILVIVSFLIFSCAANKPRTDVESGTEPTEQDIDSLFGISETEESSGQASDEDEVLRLLGITKEEAEAAPTTTPAEAEGEKKLKNEIDALEKQLSSKEAQITDLKSEIALKDDKISELESGTTSRMTQTKYSTTSSVTGDFKADYENALAEYNARNYKQAIGMFEELLSRSATNSLSDNCQYWIGECYYGLSNFNQAIIEFTKVFSFSNSNKMDAAQLKLGLCYWRLGDKQKAREEFERLISDYPQSEFIDKAESFLSRL